MRPKLASDNYWSEWCEAKEVVITRHDKPVARLIPEGRTRLASVRDAAAGLRALRKRIAKRTSGQPKLSLDDIQSAVKEGRR